MLLHLLLRCTWLAGLTWTSGSSKVLLRLLVLLRYNISSVSQIVAVVCEEIILFGVNELFNEDSGLLSLILKYSDDYVHDLWNK